MLLQSVSSASSLAAALVSVAGETPREKVQPHSFDFQFQPSGFPGQFEQAHAGRNSNNSAIAMPSVPGTATAPLGGGLQGDFGVSRSSDFDGGVQGGGSGSSTAML